MKAKVVKLVGWVSVIGLLGVLVGFLLPFVKVEGAKEASMSFVKSIKLLEEGKFIVSLVLLAVIVIAFFAFWVAVMKFRSSASLVPSVVMIASAGVGNACFGILMMMISGLEGVSKWDLGAVLTAIAYIVLVVVAVVALLLDISNKPYYNKPEEKLNA